MTRKFRKIAENSFVPAGERPRVSDSQTSIAQLKSLVLDFSRERDWEQFHHPKDLGIALASEVGELLEHFRFKTNEQVRLDLTRPEIHREVSHELADCLWAILRLADVCQVDLATSLIEKVELAALKYPIDQAFGRADKYTSYRPTQPDLDDA
jgi:dCTP diphosphatase